MKSKFKKNIMSTLVFNVLVMLVLFFQGVFTAKTLGAEGKGELAYIINVLNIIFLICGFGVRQTTSFLLRNRPKLKSEIWSAHYCFLYFSIFLGLIIFWIFSFFKIDSYYWLGVVIPISIYTNFKTSVFLLDNNINGINLSKFIISVIPFSIFAILFIFGFDVSVSYYLISYTFSHIFNLIYVTYCTEPNYYLFKVSDNLRAKNTVFFKAFIRHCFLFGMPLVLFTLNFKLDYFFVEYFLGPSLLGIYSVSTSLAELTWAIPTVLSFVIFSEGLSKKGSHAFKIEIEQKAKLLSLVLVPVFILYSFILWKAIPLIYGDEFTLSVLPSIFLLPGALCIIIFNILHGEASSRGRSGDCILPLIFGLILNAIFNMILIPYLGVIGASVSSSLSYFFSFILYYRRYRKE
ncbi:oligosaccharide flippase family protein [Vibrio parahaemolyticus]|uniref:oligosaccharide flippase family protein n=3 Tax=Vibrio parahaemolyticus TaxID=670 RepID=UPI002B2171FB|nr:polysaccharide biosynthesis C-terminal domain-containing protein [Vibrio parahaemolyticus]